MKKLLLLLFFGLLFQVNAQSRVNRAKLSFNSSSEILDKAMGWKYNNELGEWVGYDNVISDDKKYQTDYKSLQGGYMMSKVEQNFLNIQTKSVIVKDKTYYVVMVEKYEGRYEYPSIYEDWYYWKQTNGYIFTKDEYSKLLNFENEVSIETNLFVELGSSYEKYDESKFIALIQTELNSYKSNYSKKYSFPVIKTTTENEEVIRFYLPENFSSYSKPNFENKYFETSISDFNKIILKN